MASISILRLLHPSTKRFAWQTLGLELGDTRPFTSTKKQELTIPLASIWMVDVKQKYPDLQIDGFDVSISQCPPVEFLPEGCSVHELDMLKAVPEKFEGIYDVVNLRLMMAAIKDDNPVPLLKNLITMLSMFQTIDCSAQIRKW